MRHIKLITRLLVLLMAIYGLSFLQPAASATKQTGSTAADCSYCAEMQLIQLENAQTDQDYCTGGSTAQYENCLINAEMVAEEQFEGCLDFHNWDDMYEDWCWQQANATYQAFASSCDDIYFNYLLAHCFEQYSRQVNAAYEEYQHCICNCPFMEEWEKAGYGCY